jgi:DNA mismatch repair protein MutS2
MIFPANFEEKLGFDLIRSMIREMCHCNLGRGIADHIHFSAELQEIERQLMETEELRQILLFSEKFPSQDYYDLTPQLTRIRIDGSYLEPEELSEMKLSLQTITAILSFLSKHSQGKYPHLDELAGKVIIDKQILKKIDKIIDDRSNIRDDASSALKKIRNERTAKLAVVEKTINQSFKAAHRSGWTPADSGITVRDGRLVIPLLAKFKRQVGGLVHDESATGQTVFIEPAEIVELNNEIKELDFAERREIIRILVEFANFLRPSCDDLVNAYRFLGQIDFLQAKARLALNLGAKLPRTRLAMPEISWRQAIHPLLYLSHSRQKKSIVPLNITLNSSTRILVISGPNAGGKSVCLKTAGLVQYMYQCGILPTAEEESVFGLFRNIFVDIGDEQSLENDLSTYSSKLLNIKFFIENLDEASLFLIDEMGTGTDPSLGGPIAEASMEHINRSKAFGIVTTHYSNLKLLAGKFPGIENGAMLYDSRKMKPLFQLKTGLPGSSFAFEIARQIGFPEEVLKNAAEKTGKTQLDFDKQLQDVELEKAELAKKSSELKVADDFLKEMINKYEKLNRELELSKKEIIRKSKEDALQLINESNRIIEKTIREIRESQAEKEKTKAVRSELMEFREKITEHRPQAKGSAPQASGKDLTNLTNPNDPTDPTDPADPNSKLRQLLNQSIAGSEKSVTRSQQPAARGPYNSFYNDLQSKLENYQLTLDLRGKRADEAHSLLQRYIDDAILLNMTEVRILHGKGNGILRQITRDYLRSVSEVKRYQDAPLEGGGTGITIVTFK